MASSSKVTLCVALLCYRVHGVDYRQKVGYLLLEDNALLALCPIGLVCIRFKHHAGCVVMLYCTRKT